MTKSNKTHRYISEAKLKAVKWLRSTRTKNFFPLLFCCFLGAGAVCLVYAIGVSSTLLSQGDRTTVFQSEYLRWSSWVDSSHEIASDESVESSVLSGRKRGFLAALARYEGADLKAADVEVFSANCQGFLGAENPQNAHCNQYLNASSGLFAGAKLEGGHFWLAGTSGQLLWRFKSTIKPPPVVPVDATSFSRRETLRRLLWGTLIYFAIAAAMLAYKWRQEQQKMAATKKRVTVLQAAGKNIFGEFFSGEWSPDLVKDQSAIIHKLRRHITGSKRQGATVLKQEFLSSVRHKLPASTFISFLDMQVDKSLGEHAGMRENLVSFKDQCNAEFYPARDQFHILWQVWREGIQTRGLKRFLRYLSETPAGAGSQHANCLDRDLEFLESFIDTLGRYSNSLVKISDRFLDQGEVRIAWDKKIKHFLMLLSGRNESIRMHSIGETLTHLFRDEVSLRWDYAGLKEASVPAEILFSLFFSLELAAQVADVPSDAVKVQVQGRLDTIYLAIEPSSFDQDQRSHYVESLRQVFRVTEYESFQVQLSGEENKAAMVVSWEPTGNSALMVQKESMAKPVVRNIESQKTL